MDSHNIPDRGASARPISGHVLGKALRRLSKSVDVPTGPFTSIKDVLDYAIAREKESYDCYQILIALSIKPDVQKVFGAFASDELRHAEKLQAVRCGDFMFQPELVGNLGIADKAHPVRIHENMNYADALVVAMRKEKAAFRFYTRLSALSQDAKVRHMISLLAQEEARHKLSLELEYDLATF